MGKCKLRLSGETFKEKSHRGKCLTTDDQAQPAPGKPNCEQQRNPDADAKEAVHETGTELRTATCGYGGLRFAGASRRREQRFQIGGMLRKCAGKRGTRMNAVAPWPRHRVPWRRGLSLGTRDPTRWKQRHPAAAEGGVCIHIDSSPLSDRAQTELTPKSELRLFWGKTLDTGQHAGRTLRI